MDCGIGTDGNGNEGWKMPGKKWNKLGMLGKGMKR